MFEVGQIIYLLDNNEMKIIPAQVIEQVVRKRFNEDSETNYVVKLPKKNLTTVSLSEIDATVYTNLTELRDFMVNNAVQSIDRMLSRSQTIAQSYFESSDSLAPVRNEVSEVD